MGKLQIILPAVLLVLLTLACGSYSPRTEPTRAPLPTFTASIAPAASTPAPVLLVPTDTPTAEPVRAAEPVIVATEAPPVVLTIAAPPCDCSGDTLNCSDFATTKDATMCYDYCMATVGTDVHQLDRDGDGQFCESK